MNNNTKFAHHKGAILKPEEVISILNDTTDYNFNDNALKIHAFQVSNNEVYAQFYALTQRMHRQNTGLAAIPFLPIGLFKQHRVICSPYASSLCFSSSSTSGQGLSLHHVAFPAVYEHSYQKAFQYFFGSPDQYSFLALLPSYLERQGSSLIYMIQDFIRQSRQPFSGFFLDNKQELHQILLKNIEDKVATVLWGVSFALIDFVEEYQLPPNKIMVFETGGMKGRRKEMIREELHQRLREGLGVEKIYSEYGMTEMLSQAYSKGGGRFECPPWLKVLAKDPADPFGDFVYNKRGRLYMIDLANAFSCSFIETEDLGVVYNDGSFEVIGRLDHSDLRGCNLLSLG